MAGIEDSQSVTSRFDRPLSPISSFSEPADESFSINQDASTTPEKDVGRAQKSSVNGDNEKEALPPLQVAGGNPGGLDPVTSDDVEPNSFDLVMPADDVQRPAYLLDRRSELMFSRTHLQAIFDDSSHLHHFTSFLYEHRPASAPLLTYYLNALKALRAIEYSNSVVRQLRPLAQYGYTCEPSEVDSTVNQTLQAKADIAFDLLAREDLPAYITHTWIRIVTVSVRHRIRGTLPHASEGLAEVFCLTDPSRRDNPIILASEEFNRTTQYGMDYIIGRNCRFLQGPYTNPFSVKRIREKLDAGVEHYETFLNYRRDGSPFMNLLMLAPLYDSRGTIRYFIGAQVDVSGLAKHCHGLDALKIVVEQDGEKTDSEDSPRTEDDQGGEDAFCQLAEILAPNELETVRRQGGNMHRPKGMQRQWAGISDDTNGQANWSKARVVIRDPESPTANGETLNGHNGHNGHASHISHNGHNGNIDAPGHPDLLASLPHLHSGKLAGVYEHYLLVRPYPSLRILFTSPSMRLPGILQSPLLRRIGGSTRVRDELEQAFARGQGITAKVRWISGSSPGAKTTKETKPASANAHPLEAHLGADDGLDSDELNQQHSGRPRWLHCTPLLGHNGKIGVWMIVIVDDEADSGTHGTATNKGMSEHVRASRSSHSVPALAPSVRDQRANRPRLRPRRSSETLGTGILSWDGNESLVAKSLPSPHEPKPQEDIAETSSAISQLGEFYHPGALARASAKANTRTGPEVTEELILGSKSSLNKTSLAIRVPTSSRSDTSSLPSPHRLWSFSESSRGLGANHSRRRSILPGLAPIMKSSRSSSGRAKNARVEFGTISIDNSGRASKTDSE